MMRSWVLLGLVAVAGQAVAQQAPMPTIKTGTKLVVVDVTVTAASTIRCMG